MSEAVIVIIDSDSDSEDNLPRSTIAPTPTQKSPPKPRSPYTPKKLRVEPDPRQQSITQFFASPSGSAKSQCSKPTISSFFKPRSASTSISPTRVRPRGPRIELPLSDGELDAQVPAPFIYKSHSPEADAEMSRALRDSISCAKPMANEFLQAEGDDNMSRALPESTASTTAAQVKEGPVVSSRNALDESSTPTNAIPKEPRAHIEAPLQVQELHRQLGRVDPSLDEPATRTIIAPTSTNGGARKVSSHKLRRIYGESLAKLKRNGAGGAPIKDLPKLPRFGEAPPEDLLERSEMRGGLAEGSPMLPKASPSTSSSTINELENGSGPKKSQRRAYFEHEENGDQRVNHARWEAVRNEPIIPIELSNFLHPRYSQSSRPLPLPPP